MSTVAVNKRNHVLAFVALHHAQQKRKYTGEPYLFHLKSVADMADGKCVLGYEIGLCHDLFEDTTCNIKELHAALIRFGYTHDESSKICHCVYELTDVYTPEAFPQINRAKRKELEATRLHKVSYEAQTVKYCDLMDNTKSIVEHDLGFAQKYIPEKRSILKGMKNGNPTTYKQALKSLKKAENALIA